MIPPLPLDEFKLISDASGHWGCGAYWDCEWFQLPWNNTFLDTHISAKELTPIVVATAIWGKAWKGHAILVLSDNTAVVAAINSHTLSLKKSAHLLCCLAFLTAHHQCDLHARYLPSQHNLRGIKICQSWTNATNRQPRLPITLEALLRIKEHQGIDTDSLHSFLLWVSKIRRSMRGNQRLVWLNKGPNCTRHTDWQHRQPTTP